MPRIRFCNVINGFIFIFSDLNVHRSLRLEAAFNKPSNVISTKINSQFLKAENRLTVLASLCCFLPAVPAENYHPSFTQSRPVPWCLARTRNAGKFKSYTISSGLKQQQVLLKQQIAMRCYTRMKKGHPRKRTELDESILYKDRNEVTQKVYLSGLRNLEGRFE